jgi:hypothetical protein
VSLGRLSVVSAMIEEPHLIPLVKGTMRLGGTTSCAGKSVSPDGAAGGEAHATPSFWTSASGGMWGGRGIRAVALQMPHSGRARERKHQSL